MGVPDSLPVLEPFGASRVVRGNRRVDLVTPGGLWLVVEGALELFALLPAGERRRLASFGPGDLLFGGADTEARLTAVALRDTRLLEVPRDRLLPLARDPEVVPRLAEGVGRWVGRLFDDLVQDAPPKRFEVLGPGQELVLEEEGAVRCQGRLAWVRLVTGTARLMASPALPLASHGELVPLVDRAWLAAAAGSRLSGVGTEAVIRSGSLWGALSAFHGDFLEYLGELAAAEAESDRQLHSRRLARDRRALQAASLDLASVLGDSPPTGVAALEEGDALLAACREVGAAAHLRIRPPVAAGEEANRAQGSLARICDASGVRHRRVLLREGWHRRDAGPLLAFRAGAQGSPDVSRPVALLPSKPGRYDLWDPASGERVPVDDELASALSGIAFMLYRPLPERAVDWRDLVRMALEQARGDLGSLVGVGVAGGLLALAVPLMTAYVFGTVIPGSDRSQLLQVTLGLVLAASATAAFQVTRGIAVLRLGGKMDGVLQSSVWDRLLRLPVSFYRRYTVGDLAYRSMGLDRIRALLTGDVTNAVLASVFSVFSLGLLFYYSWKLALVACGLVLVLALVTLTLTYFQVRHQRAILEIQGEVSGLLFGFFQGMFKLRSAAAEERAYALWARHFAEQRRETVRARHLANVQAVTGAVFRLLTLLALFAMVGISLRDQLPLSEFLGFVAAFAQFQAAALSSIGVLSSILVMIPLYERLRPILETPPEVDEAKSPAGDLLGRLELSHVSFRYDPEGPQVLDDVSIRVEPGDFVALVGPSGSGKSTLLRLLLGFEEPESGSIYVDGMDLRGLDVQSVRRQTGVVLQNGQPFTGDLFSNIVGNSQLTHEDAWEAAAMAGLAEDIRTMPMGMHTVVSEGGGTLSGGQRQRLLIARAIVHRPRIILFDEATSALDNRTQEIVSRSLERLKATRIVVAHRLSTIQNADRIYVLDGGRVVEEGGFAELKDRGGLFSRLVQRQTV